MIVMIKGSSKILQRTQTRFFSFEGRSLLSNLAYRMQCPKKNICPNISWSFGGGPSNIRARQLQSTYMFAMKTNWLCFKKIVFLLKSCHHLQMHPICKITKIAQGDMWKNSDSSFQIFKFLQISNFFKFHLYLCFRFEIE